MGPTRPPLSASGLGFDVYVILVSASREFFAWQNSEESIMRNLHGQAVPAARVRFDAQDSSMHSHARCRHFSSRSGREPDNNEELRSLLNWLREPYVQAAGAEIVKAGIGLECLAIRIHATHCSWERGAHARLSPPLYPTVKARQDVIALRIVDPYFSFINCLSPASF
jgi:hypothetical protein